MFTPNIHSVDRLLRLIIGTILVVLAFIGPASPWGYAGFVLIVTAFINFCPLYAVFKFSTKPDKTDKHS